MNTDIRTALVTGGAQGIGRGICEHLSAHGSRVFALDLDEGALSGLAAPAGADLVTIAADVSDEASVRSALAEVKDRAGRLDLLVNNAGLAGPSSGPVDELPLEDWNRWIGTNLTGAFLMTKHAVPLLRQAKGSIVNMTSTRAFMSEPETEAYAASKGGLFALTHALAISLGPDIRVNGIAPGWIDTSTHQKASAGPPDDLREIDHAQHPAGRVGRPEDVAKAVAYLAEAEFVTGETITIDGGMTRKMIYQD